MPRMVNGRATEEGNREQRPKTSPLIEIHVKPQAQNSADNLVFQLKKSTKLQVMMNKYSKLRGEQLDTIRFMYDGVRIKGEDTPLSLQMEDGDSIDVFYAQLAG
mmetsp:Transcript_8419/g.21743  ORF Transcript_8419/g.21743 Transcript_8419/m.21743 type:complete len:104 (-) Transcript_8419:271-582(-)